MIGISDHGILIAMRTGSDRSVFQSAAGSYGLTARAHVTVAATDDTLTKRYLTHVS
jgi:hypothetical protein